MNEEDDDHSDLLLEVVLLEILNYNKQLLLYWMGGGK